MNKPSTTSSIFKHTFIYSISSVLQKAVGFIMLPIYANYLGAEGYGIVGMIDVVTSALTVFVGFGVTGALNRFYHEKHSESERATLVSTSLILMLLLVLGCSLPFFLFYQPLSVLAFGREGLELCLILGLLTFVFDMGSLSANGYLFIQQKSKLFTLLSLGKLLLGLALNIQLVVIAKLGVLGVLYSNLATTLLFFLAVQGWAFRQVGFAFHRGEARAILKYSLPLLPGYLAMFLRNNADRVILAKFLGLGHLGVYTMLLNFSNLVSVFLLTPFLNVWNNQRFKVCQEPDGPVRLARVYTLHLALLCFFGLVLALQVPLLLRVLTPAEFWVPGGYAFLAVLSVVLFASYYHFVFGMAFAKATMQISQGQMLASAVSVVSGLLLIPPFGLLGALIAANLVYGVLCLYAYRASQRHFVIPFEWGKVCRTAGAASLLFFLCNALSPADTALGHQLQGYLRPGIEPLLRALQLHQVRDGKLLAYALGNVPVLIDGAFRLLLSLLFPLVLVALGVLSREQVLKPLQVFHRLKAGRQVLA